MVQYTCEKCFKEFDRKFLFDQHQNRKTSCVGDSKINQKKHINKCKICQKEFSRPDSLTRHYQNCKIKKVSNTIKGENIILVSGDNSNNNSNNISLNGNVFVNMVFFGKDGIKNISPKDLSEILKSNKNIFESLISNVNFNPNKPEHHNIYYGDLKSSYGEVYENKKWAIKKIDEILNTLLDAKTEDLNEIINDMNDFLNKKTRQKILDAIENADYSKPNNRKHLKSYLRAILYNNKEMIIKTRKLTKEQEEDFLRREQEQIELEAAMEKNKPKKD